MPIYITKETDIIETRTPAEIMACNEDVNQFHIVGTVTNMRDIGEGTMLYIEVENTDRSRPHVSSIPVVFYGDDAAQTISKALRRGERVRKVRVAVDGFIRTRNQRDRDGNYKYFQDYVGTRLDNAGTLMENEFGVEGVGHLQSPSENKIKIVGDVVNVHTRNGENGEPICTFVNIKTTVHGRMYMPKVVFFNSYDAIRQIMDGDRVMVLAEIFVKAVPNDDKTIFLDSVIGVELQRVSSSAAQGDKPAKRRRKEKEHRPVAPRGGKGILIMPGAARSE